MAQPFKLVPTAVDRWTTEVKAYGVAEVALLSGMTLGRSRDLSPCPACGAERRGRSDPRGPAGLTPDGRGWRCHRCSAGGDTIALVAWVVKGLEPKALGPDEWKDVRAWCANHGLCSAPPDDRPPDLVRGRLCPRPVVRRPPPELPAPQPPPRPPLHEVAEIWELCRPVTQDAAVRVWLEGRGFDPGRLTFMVDRDLARALPMGRPLPQWCTFKGRPWNATGHRLVVRLYGPGGRPESLHARNILPDCKPGEKAAAAAAGPGSTAGLVMADPLALFMLEAGRVPDWWGEGPFRLVVTEGEPDFLVWATHYGDTLPEAPAVIGVVAGSWTPEIAARVPGGAKVIIRTHADGPGEKYAGRIHATLCNRCTVLRGGV